MLWSDCMYEQADLKLCWSHIAHSWKSVSQLPWFQTKCHICQWDSLVIILCVDALSPCQQFSVMLGWLCCFPGLNHRSCNIEPLVEPALQRIKWQPSASSELWGWKTCPDPERVVRGGPTLTTFFFLVDEGREGPNTTIIGTSSTPQQNAI